MECGVIDIIQRGQQEFQICSDKTGNLHIGPTGNGCFCDNGLAQARFDGATGTYTLIEHNVFDRESTVKCQCVSKEEAVRRLAELVG